MRGSNASDVESRMANLLTKRRYFWDKGPLHVKRDQYVIIERVLEYGTEDEVNTILAHYGPEAVKTVVRESRGLSKRTVNCFAFLLGISRSETRCFSDASLKIWQPY